MSIRQEQKSKTEVQSISSNSGIISDMSHASNDSDGYYAEGDCYNRKVINKFQENSKNDMKMICDEYGFDQDLVRLLVELEFDLDIYCKLKISGILHNYNTYGE